MSGSSLIPESVGFVLRILLCSTDNTDAPQELFTSILKSMLSCCRRFIFTIRGSLLQLTNMILLHRPIQMLSGPLQ